MKLLGLFRHAKSDWQDARARDFDRGLNARGRKGAVVMGKHIVDHGVPWQRILASPAVRVAETIELSSRAVGREVPVQWDRRIYLASSVILAEVLHEVPDTVDSVMMVGHNPGLEDLIFDLVPDDGTSPLRGVVEDKFPTAAFAVLECDIDHWADLHDGCARLVHLKRPRDIDAKLGPAAVD